MIKSLSDTVVEVRAHHPTVIETDLTKAEQMARERAMIQGRHGILVTQHDYCLFTVAVSEDVPFGQTRESRQWADNVDLTQEPALG